MPRTCTICCHPKIEDINKAIIEGNSIRDIAKQFRLNSSSVDRHKKNHLPTLLVKAEDARKESLCL